jgi:hypothetical protein
MGVDGMMIVVYFLWLYFVCMYYVARGTNFKARAWERIYRTQLLLDILSTKMCKLLVSTAQIAPMGGTIIEIESTRQLQFCINAKES